MCSYDISVPQSISGSGGVVILKYQDAGSIRMASLSLSYLKTSGFSLAPEFGVNSSGEIEFSNLSVGQSAKKRVKIVNQGNTVSPKIGKIKTTIRNKAISLISDTCSGAELAPEASCFLTFKLNSENLFSGSSVGSVELINEMGGSVIASIPLVYDILGTRLETDTPVGVDLSKLGGIGLDACLQDPAVINKADCFYGFADRSDIAVNGDFSNGGGGWNTWSAGSGSMVHQANNSLRFTTPSTGNCARGYQELNTEPGVLYQVKMDHLSNVSNYTVKIYKNSPNLGVYDFLASQGANSNGSVDMSFVAEDTTEYLSVECNSSAVGGYIEIDNVQVISIKSQKLDTKAFLTYSNLDCNDGKCFYSLEYTMENFPLRLPITLSFNDEGASSTQNLNYIAKPGVSAPNSEIINRALVQDDLNSFGSFMGIERVIFKNIFNQEGERGPENQSVFSPFDNGDNRFRFVGSWIVDNGSSGRSVRSVNFSSDNTFVEFTFYGTGLSIVGQSAAANILNGNVYINGVSQGSLALLSGTSNVLNGRGYENNTIFNIVKDLPFGLHTVKIEGVAGNNDNLFLYGVEILNQREDILVGAGNAVRGGFIEDVVSSKTFSYKPTGMGSSGGRVVLYNFNNNLEQSFTNVSAAKFLTQTDHGEEEIIKSLNLSDFSNNGSDGFASSFNGDLWVTLDDGTTTLQTDNGVASSGHLLLSDPGSWTFTFVGTGLDVVGRIGGNIGSFSLIIDGQTYPIVTSSLHGVVNQPFTWSIASGLPYGTHTVKVNRVANQDSFFPKDFIIYGPKKPLLPEGALEIADYNVLADYSITTAGNEKISTGVLRKIARKELRFTGTWGIDSGVYSTGYISEQLYDASTSFGTMSYTFYGTGFELRNKAFSSYHNSIKVRLNGVDLNELNYPSAAFSDYGYDDGFNSSTAILSMRSAANNGGAGFSVSQLPLDVYTVEFDKNGNSQTFSVEAFDIITPIHVNDLNNQIGSLSLADIRKKSSDAQQMQRSVALSGLDVSLDQVVINDEDTIHSISITNTSSGDLDFRNFLKLNSGDDKIRLVSLGTCKNAVLGVGESCDLRVKILYNYFDTDGDVLNYSISVLGEEIPGTISIGQVVGPAAIVESSVIGSAHPIIEPQSMTLTVKDVNGVLLKGKEVIISSQESELSRVTDSNGQVTFEYGLDKDYYSMSELKDGVLEVSSLQSVSYTIDSNDFTQSYIPTYRNCSEHLSLGGVSVSGNQVIDFDGDGPLSEVLTHCDMETDTKGWTLAASVDKGQTLWNEWTTSMGTLGDVKFGIAMENFSSQEDGKDLEVFIKVDDVAKNPIYKNVMLSTSFNATVNPGSPQLYQTEAVLLRNIGNATATVCEGDLYVGANAWNWSISHLSATGTCLSYNGSDGGVLLHGDAGDDTLSYIYGLYEYSNYVSFSNVKVYVKPPVFVMPASCSDLKDRNPLAQSGVYEIDADGVGGQEPVNTFCAFDSSVLLAPSTSSASLASFDSQIVNRTPIVNPMLSLNSQMGVERLLFEGIEQLNSEQVSFGNVYRPTPVDSFDRIRLGGTWSFGDFNGPSLISSNPTAFTSPNNFMEVTFYGTGLNLLLSNRNDQNSVDLFARVEVDGVDQGLVEITAGSDGVINGLGGRTNQSMKIVSGLSEGIHTVRIKGDASNSNPNNFAFYGFDILNERDNVLVHPGLAFNKDRENYVELNSEVEHPYQLNNTPAGGRVSLYLDENGDIKKAVNAIEGNHILELVDQGTFDSQGDWVFVGGTSIDASNQLSIVNASSYAKQVVSTEAGKTYQLSFNLIGASSISHAYLEIQDDTAGINDRGGPVQPGLYFSGSINQIGYNQYKFKALSNSSKIVFHAEVVGGASMVVDDVSVKEFPGKFLADADHSSEELIYKKKYLDFGTGANYDFSSLLGNNASPVDKAYAFEDGTMLMGNDINDGSGWNNPENRALQLGNSESFVRLTFVGTGVDVSVATDSNNRYFDAYIDGVKVGEIFKAGGTSESIEKIASGLPYGSHILTIKRKAGLPGAGLKDFYIYGPKPAQVPANGVKIADYKAVANLKLNTLVQADSISTGVIRISPMREAIYDGGNWNIDTNGLYPTGRAAYANNSPGAFFEYTFFGTGFDHRFMSDAARPNGVKVSLNDQDLNFTNYPSALFSTVGLGINFNDSSAILDANSGGEGLPGNADQPGAGFSTINLPLAQHKVKFTQEISSGGSTNHVNSGIDVVTPIHDLKGIERSQISLPSSCKDLLESDASLLGQDGNYFISVGGKVVEVYCDMTSDGGGWTLVFNNNNAFTISAMGTAVPTLTQEGVHPDKSLMNLQEGLVRFVADSNQGTSYVNAYLSGGQASDFFARMKNESGPSVHNFGTLSLSAGEGNVCNLASITGGLSAYRDINDYWNVNHTSGAASGLVGHFFSYAAICNVQVNNSGDWYSLIYIK